MTWQDYEADLEPRLEDLHRRVHRGAYHPQPSRRTYEGDFCGFSYGFRPGRGPHDAMDALCTAIGKRKVNWIIDADIQNFLRGSQPILAGSLPGAQDRRQAHHSPDPEMAEGGHSRRRGRDRR